MHHSVPFAVVLVTAAVVECQLLVNNLTDPNSVLQCQSTSFSWQNSTTSNGSSDPFGFMMNSTLSPGTSSFYFFPLNSSITSFSIEIPFIAGSLFSFGVLQDNSTSSSPDYTIGQGDQSNCFLAYQLSGPTFTSNAPLKLLESPVTSQSCQDITWIWTGGQPPFQFNLVWSHDGLDVTWSVYDILAREISFQLPIPSGSQYIATVSDSDSTSSNDPVSVGPVNVVDGDSTACLLNFTLGLSSTSPPPPNNSPPPTSSNSNSSSNKNLGAIIGGSVGGAVVLIGGGILLLLFIRRKRRTSPEDSQTNLIQSNEKATENNTVDSPLTPTAFEVSFATHQPNVSSTDLSTYASSNRGLSSTPLASKRKSTVSRKPPPIFESPDE